MNKPIIWIAIFISAPICCCMGAALQGTFTPLVDVTRSSPIRDFIILRPTALAVEAPEVAGENTLGQMEVEYTPRMSPGASNGTFVVAIGIPELLAGDVPVSVEIITFSDETPPVLGAREREQVVLYISRQMRVELIAPAFTIGGPASVTQTVNIDEINKPTFWTWNLVAPEATGDHDVTLKVYQLLDPGREIEALPPRIYQIEVVEPTATPLPPTPTPLPTPTNTLTPTSIPPTPTPTPVPFLKFLSFSGSFSESNSMFLIGLTAVVVIIIGLYIRFGRPAGNRLSSETTAPSYDLSKIHTLLNDIFSEEDLRDYCLTHDPFRSIYEQLKESDRKGDILRKLLDHARKKGRLAELLVWAKEANPARYAAGEPYER